LFVAVCARDSARTRKRERARVRGRERERVRKCVRERANERFKFLDSGLAQGTDCFVHTATREQALGFRVQDLGFRMYGTSRMYRV
jgi:hypothetical protein